MNHTAEWPFTDRETGSAQVAPIRAVSLSEQRLCKPKVGSSILSTGTIVCL